MQMRGLPSSLYRIQRLSQADELAQHPVVRQRLGLLRRWWQARQQFGLTAEQAARLLGKSRATLQRWQRAYREQGLGGLLPQSRRPHKVRQPLTSSGWSVPSACCASTSPPTASSSCGDCCSAGAPSHGSVSCCADAITSWPKRSKHCPTSSSASRRAPSDASSADGCVRACCSASSAATSARRRAKRQRSRPWAQRYQPAAARAVQRPGERVQLDTLHYRTPWGQRIVQFTACDVVSRWQLVAAYSSASARCARHFLKQLLQRMPFAVQCLQVDGGSEFRSEFEAACAQLQLPLQVLPPRSPKLNAYVERAQGNWRYECYEAYELPAQLSELRKELQYHEFWHNYVRPHQGLGGLSPFDYLQKHFPELAPPSPAAHIY